MVPCRAGMVGTRAAAASAAYAYPQARAVAAALAFGPVAIALLLALVLPAPGGRRKSPVWPFHKERLVGKLGLHLAVGFCVGVLPVYHLAETLLLAKGDGAACALWGGC